MHLGGIGEDQIARFTHDTAQRRSSRGGEQLVLGQISTGGPADAPCRVSPHSTPV